MRLFQMEVYKLLHRKMAVFGGIAVILILLSFFIAIVAGEETVVYGQHYRGLEAIKKDREITKPFAGELTDQKINEIVDTYGLPRKVEEDYGYWRDGNYLTGFVTEYFSDGYMYGWEKGEYKAPEHTIPIAQSDIGKNAAEIGKNITFDYNKGYEYFAEYCQLGMILAAVWVILVVSPLFAEEFQMKTNALIFTTEHGKRRDIAAKILAGLFVMLCAYLWVILSGLLFCGSIFGFSGGDMLNGIVMGMGTWVEDHPSLTYIKAWNFLLLYIFMLLTGMLMTVSFSIWVSSKVRTSYHAVIYMLLIFTGPFLILLLVNGRIANLFFYLMPLGQMMIEFQIDAFDFAGGLSMIFAAVVVLGGLCSGWRRYKNIEGV